MKENELFKYYNQRDKKEKYYWDFKYWKFLEHCLLNNLLNYNSNIFSEIENYIRDAEILSNDIIEERGGQPLYWQILELDELDELARNNIFWND